MKPTAMPSAMENVSGIATMVSSAGSSSVASSQARSRMPPSINKATNTRAPLVANSGTMRASGARNMASRNRMPTATAVNPVRPPPAMPATLST